MKNFTLAIASLLLFSCTSQTVRQPQAEARLEFGEMEYDTHVPGVGTVELRTGVFYETDKFKGCVIYLEGLADSIANHQKFFSQLSQNGYRVITFDYMGQGGSKGSMNHTRLEDPVFPDLEIGNQAKHVWNYFSQADSHDRPNCSAGKKLVIGWSTGGLAAYKLANEGWADSVAMIAPGIHPKKFVGEAARSPGKLLTLQKVITERTLTRNSFAKQANPHVDAIKPDSPAKVPLFAANLVATSVKSLFWDIKADVKGIVFLGTGDTYVDYAATKKTLARRAPHFSVIQYDGAMHELHNEVPAVVDDLLQNTLAFFNSL